MPESRDLIWSWGLLRAQLTEAWAGRPRPLPEFWPLPQDRAAAVRAAYRQVLTAARARGLVRRPRQTPAGFLAALRTLWPDEAPLLEALTRLYVAARYGQVPPPEAEWAAVRAGLGRIAAPDEHPKT